MDKFKFDKNDVPLEITIDIDFIPYRFLFEYNTPNDFYTLTIKNISGKNLYSNVLRMERNATNEFFDFSKMLVPFSFSENVLELTQSTQDKTEVLLI